MTATRKFSLVAILALAVALGAVAYWRLIEFPRRHPNILLIIGDTLRADHLPMYGYSRPTAPFLTQMSRDSAVFDASSPTSWTKSAVATIMTGLHPVRHQSFARTDVLSPDVHPLAEVLSAGGYSAHGITANAWVGKNFEFDRGYRTFQSTIATEDEAPDGEQ